MVPGVTPGVTGREAIDEGMARLAALVESSEDAIIGQDSQAVITSWNAAAERMFGYTAAEVIGKSIDILAPPDRAAELARIYAEVLDGGRVEHFETERVRRDGRRLQVSLSISPIRDRSGRIVGLSKISRDITERKRAEAELAEKNRQLQDAYEEVQVAEEELRSHNEELLLTRQAIEAERLRYLQLFELAPDGYLVTDAGGRIAEANRAAAELLATPQDQLAEKLLESFVEEDGHGAFHSHLSQIGAGRGVWELRFKPPGREPFEAEVKVLPAAGGLDGDRAGLRWMLRDVTERRRAERDNARLAALVESSPDAIMGIDEEGRIQAWNPAAESLFGYTASEAIGRPVSVLSPAERATEPMTLARRVLAGESLPPFDTFRLRKDGQRLEVSLSLAPIRGPEGEITGVSAIVRDIGPRKRTEAAHYLLADAGRVLAASHDLATTFQNAAQLAVSGFADLCIIDLLDERREGGVERIATAHADPAKVPLARELRRHVPRLDDTTPVMQVLRTGEPIVAPELSRSMLEASYRGPEHARLLTQLAPSSLLIVPLIAKGRTLGAWGFFYTESGRRYRQEDLAVAEELARRAAEAADNVRLYRAAEQANAAKDQFLAALSHELRTPLTPVLAFVSDLAEDARLPADVRAKLVAIRRNVELEARLIDDLLDLTRITHGKLEIKPEVTDLSEVLEHALDICCGTEVASGRLKVVREMAADRHHVWGDAPRLTQVFWNLFRNAVKFMPEGGEMRVRTAVEIPAASAASATGGQRLRIEVADTGIGIDPADLPRVFDGFEQGPRTITRQFGGLGLGLAISKAIVDLHGGSLRAASEGLGKGATFSLELPLAEVSLAEMAETRPVPGRAPAPAPAMSPTEPGERRADHILLVEDHADTAAAFAELLRASGYVVTTASSVREGLTAAARGGVDLVISDLGLPDGHGYELMREIVRRHGFPGIALSGYGMDEDVRQSREAGFSRHLTKPVKLKVLREAIREVLTEREG
jgi:two-component system CheB/CheR fusion protein